MIKVYQYTKLSSFLASHDIQQTFYSLSITQCSVEFHPKLETFLFAILRRWLLDTSDHYLADPSAVVQKLLLSNVLTHSATAPQVESMTL